jgi:exopolysaccharide production protein ExoY
MHQAPEPVPEDRSRFESRRPTLRAIDWAPSHPAGHPEASMPPSPTRVMSALKRTIDIVGGGLALVLGLPILLIACIAVMIESPGSPLFVHRRIGRFGREVNVLKIRTMVPDAERHLELVLTSDPRARADWSRHYKIMSDPRVTRVGAVLRRLSLDELPQLLNVVLGQMSLVGPRPMVTEEIARFGSNQTVLLSVRPGLTSSWAVSGRSDVSCEERMRIELEYVNDWSLALDARILVRTIPALLRRTGAY